jgi:integrase
MPAKSITDAFVRNVKSPAPISRRQITYIDTLERGLALVLVVSYGGTKTFRVLTYRNGKARTRKLGTYPALSVKEARAQAREYWEDPSKVEAKAAVGTFKEIAENWIKRYVDLHGLRSKPEIQRILDKHLYPEWGDRPFLEIRRGEVNKLLDTVIDADSHRRSQHRKNQGRSQADSVLAVIRAIMTWHQSRDENYTSPIVKGMRRHKSKPRDRVLSDDEIRALWTALDEFNSFGLVVKLCLLTAQRSRKIASMRWQDLKDGVWFIPQQDREKGTARSLKLAPLAWQIVQSQPRLKDNPYVFASRPFKHFNSWSQQKSALEGELKKLLPDMQPWTIHDLRRTARSIMSRAGVRRDIAERVLGHAIAGVEGVYDRHDYFDEKSEAMICLSSEVEAILNTRKGQCGGPENSAVSCILR